MIRINNLETTRYNKPNIENSKKVQNSAFTKYGFSQIEFSGKKTKPITLNEGLLLLGKGAKQQCIDTLQSLFGSPKALIGWVGFTLGMSLLPLIGIPASVGGGVLAIGFGAVALTKTVKHSLAFAKNNREGQYNLARKNLKTIGEDSVDLALSLPFVPKSVSKVNTFVKHGKVQLNKDIIKNRTFGDALDSLFSEKTDANLERSLSFKKSAAQELSKSSSQLSKQELAKLAKDLEDYNVPFDKIPKVVLEKWAQEHNIHTMPELSFKTLENNTSGLANSRTCSIVINDYKTQIVSLPKYDLLEVKQVNNNYNYTYRNKETGKIIVEEVPKQIIDDYNALRAKLSAMSPQISQIMTTIHEREHIDQFARIVNIKGSNIFQPTNSAKTIYENMIKEIQKIGETSEKTQEINNIIAHLQPDNGTFVRYLQRPLEIGARKAETEALKNPFYTHLDNVYQSVNAQKPKSAISRAVYMNTARADSLVS